MSTRIFNLAITSSPVPGPSFFYSRDSEGKMTGRHTFTAVKGSMQMPANQSRFAKGTPVTALDPSISSTLSFMTLEDFEVQTIPGGYEEISANFSGYSEGGDFEFDREITYSSNNTLVESSIMKHPRLIEELTLQERSGFAKLLDGTWYAEETITDGNLTSVAVNDPIADAVEFTITGEDALAWYKLIFIEKFETYWTRAFDWNKSTANAGGISNAELAELGKIDSNPPGSAPEPPAQTGFTWLKMSASDVRGESSASTEESWQWGYWPTRIYSDD